MNMNHLTNPTSSGCRWAARHLAVACIASLAFGVIGCSTTSPRVLEVSSRTRLKNIDPADEEYFVNDQASRIKYELRDLSIDEQREEFYVRWSRGRATVNLVKFEYRQLARPDVIGEQTYVPAHDTSKVFKVHGEEFRSGGVISAWRVSLWDGDHLVGEKKSFLW